MGKAALRSKSVAAKRGRAPLPKGPSKSAAALKPKAQPPAPPKKNGEPARAKKNGAAPSRPPQPTPSGRGGLVLPGWIRPRVDGLIQKLQDVDWDEQGPDQLAIAWLDGIKELAAEELGDHAATVGAVRLESLRFALTKSLGKEFEVREGLEGLGKSATKGWLQKVLTRALGLKFDDPPRLGAPVLARPLFEHAIGDVLERVRGTASDPRTVVRSLLESIDKTARDAGLDAIAERVAACRRATVPLEQAIKRALVPLHVSGATGAGWARLGFDDLAARARSSGEWVSVSRAIWVGRREHATALLDRIGVPLGLVWEAVDTKGSGDWTQRLGAAGVLRPYRPDQMFSRGDAVTHPRFGIGVVTTVEQGRVEVTFPDGVRKLAHAG